MPNKILIIEDEPGIRTALMNILELNNYFPIAAENGPKGIELFKSENPDLIICDIMMPKMDGFQVLEELKNDSNLHIPFIFLTAMAQYNDLRRGMNLGADDYVFKPFKSIDILKSIENQFNKIKSRTTEIKRKLEKLESLVSLMIGHEFNTPMNGIIAMKNSIKDYVASINNIELIENVNILEKSCERLENTFKKVNKIYQIRQKGVSKDNHSHTSITNNYITGIADKIAINFKRNNDLIIQNIAIGSIRIIPVLFYTCITEIIENAFKFSTSGNKVIVESKIISDKYILSVIDQGSQINSKSLSSLKPFEQYNRKKYEQQGLGAGLTLVYEILNQVNGSLLFSDNLSHGIKAELTFNL